MNRLDLDPRRRASRISIDGLCGVVAKDDLTHASLRDLSDVGVRLERVFDPKTATSIVQLEIELPGIDEVVWARAVVKHAVLTPLPGRTPEGQPRFWCRAGLRLGGVCRAERQMLHDYVFETRRAIQLAAAAAA